MAIRVLIVDSDIPFMVRVKQALDETNEFSVSISANGLAAEDALRHHRHDIAVIDFAIPDADAAALIAQLRHVQPGLPVIVCPTDSAERTAAGDLAVQGVLEKPYAARELIALVRQIVPRDPRAELLHEDEDDFIPPEMPPGLRHLLDQARPPAEAGESPSADAATPEAAPAWDDAPAAHPATELLDQPDDPVSTAQLPETETFDDLIEREWGHSRIRLHPEPPVQPDDTPTVPDRDLDSIRQFLATDYQGHDSPEFSEVLDAVAHAGPDEAAPPPRDEFHELVESLRISEPAPGSRSPLEDLLTSMAAEQAAQYDEVVEVETSSTLDYVLSAIRRGARPSEETPADELADGDETIGDVMNGLFEPSFEGVLAALAGEDIDEDEYDDEPASADERPTPDAGSAPADAVFEDFLSEDDPAWLVDYQAGGIVPDDELAAQEPDSDEEDSSLYPATQALNAVSDAGTPEFSLDALLAEIEQRLPLSETRPQLKPLPSWNQSELSRDASRLSALFDRQAGPEDDVPPPPDEMFREPPVSKEDTRPSQMVLDELNRLVGEPGAPRPAPTEPSSAGVWGDIQPPTDIQPPPPADDERLPAQAATSEEADVQAWTPEADLFEGERAPQAALDTEDAARADDELAGIFEELLADAAQVGQAADAGPGQPIDEGRAEEDAGWGWPDEDPAQAVAWEGAPVDEPGADEDAAAPPEVVPEAVTAPEQPEVEPSPAAPPAAAASDLDEDAALAQLAVQLTQFSLESSSQAILLTRGDERLAEAGDLPPSAMDHLFTEIARAWQTSTVESDTLMRYIRVPEFGEFLLYSMLVEDGLLLSMVFHAGTSIRTIRRQARRLSVSLASVPEDVAEADSFDPPADVVWDTAPVEPQPIEDLREAAEQALEQAATGHPAREAALAQDGTSQPAAPDEPAIAYTCLWLVRDPAVELTGDLAEDLNNWLSEVADEAGSTLHQLAITGDSVLVTLSIPQKTPPDAVIVQLMDETARAAAAYYPESVDEDRPLWADGYYLITPPRDLSDREIARFASYQYQD